MQQVNTCLHVCSKEHWCNGVPCLSAADDLACPAATVSCRQALQPLPTPPQSPPPPSRRQLGPRPRLHPQPPLRQLAPPPRPSSRPQPQQPMRLLPRVARCWRGDHGVAASLTVAAWVVLGGVAMASAAGRIPCSTAAMFSAAPACPGTCATPSAPTGCRRTHVQAPAGRSD